MALLTYIRNEWDRVLAWVLVGIGALALILGWIGVTSTPYTFEMIPYVLSGGIGGLFLLGVGAMLWISADLRDEWRTLHELLEQESVHTDPVEDLPLDGQRTRSEAPLASSNGAATRPVRARR